MDNYEVKIVKTNEKIESMTLISDAKHYVEKAVNTFNTNKEIAKCIYEYLKWNYKNESWLVYVLNYDKSKYAHWSKKGNYRYINLTFMKIGQKSMMIIKL